MGHRLFNIDDLVLWHRSLLRHTCRMQKRLSPVHGRVAQPET
jgi:hypothetical protein